MSEKIKQLRDRLAEFRTAANQLCAAWEQVEGGGGMVENYPDYLPSFEQFSDDVARMRVKENELPELPPAGAILRARYDLDCGGMGRWPEGWTGTLKGWDGEHVHVEAHRYIAELREYDNCRVIGVDDGVSACWNRYGYEPDETTPRSQLVALALLQEFEVC